jgi:ribokinase
MSQVIVVGSANIDLIAQVEHLPQPGETVLGSDVAQRPGGKGANQAVAASRLGADTTMFAAVGQDAFGDQVVASLASQGVRVEHVTRQPGVATGLAAVTVSASGENCIVVASGANARLDPLALNAFEQVCGPGDVLVLQLEVPVATCLAAARKARACGARVVLNAAPPPKPGDALFLDLLREVDVLILNEGEALELAGRNGLPNGFDWTALADALRALGPRSVVVTLGGQGAVAASPDGTCAQPSFRVDVVDTTGAGDAFCGAFAAAYAQGRQLAEALRRGCAAGAVATTQLGAQSALPTTTDLDRLLADEEPLVKVDHHA